MRLWSTGLLAVALCHVPVMAQRTEGAESEVRAVWDKFEEHYGSGDAAGVAALYAEDASRIILNGEVAEGRTAILQQYERAVASRAADPDVLPYRADIRVRLITGNIAILDGVARRTADETYQFTVILQKRNDQWLIVAGRPRGRLLN